MQAYRYTDSEICEYFRGQNAQSQAKLNVVLWLDSGLVDLTANQ